MALHLALLLTLLETLALSGVLLLWARQVAGSRLLVVFLLGVATWIVGNELPNGLGLGSAPLAMALLSSLPLTSAAFLHFCVIFCGLPVRRRWLVAAYALAGVGVAVSLLHSPGDFIHYPPFRGMQWVVMPNAVGWTTSLIWGLLAAGGLLALAWGFVRTPLPQRRKQMAAIATACAWGLLAMSGFSFVSLQLPFYPWPVLLFPVFPLLLVYGVLRYRVFVVNVWARRALASAMLVLLGLGAVSLTVLLPVESKWLNAVVVTATCLTLSGPVWRVAARLVYPGGTPSADDLRDWRQQLTQAESLPQLSDMASALLTRRMGTPVQVHLRAPPPEANASASGPAMQPIHTPEAKGATAAEWTSPRAVTSTHETHEPHEVHAAHSALASPTAHPAHHPAPPTANTAPTEPSTEPPAIFYWRETGHTPSNWQTRLQGFDEAPPGQRHLAELFAATLADAATQVELAQLAREREREQQLQARLAELGALAATVAHDVRNPLNIIAMAVAMAPRETRQEVGEQIARISHLTADLLDYAKPWQIQPLPTDIHPRIQALLRHRPEVEQGPELNTPCWVTLDPARFDQAFINLLTNASTAASGRRVRVETEATPDAVLVHVCDDGPGIPPDLRERLFEPFASRSTGGTGLGLAIVARIMAAHGGSAVVSERPPWRTCLSLRFARTPDDARTPPAQPVRPAQSPIDAPTGADAADDFAAFGALGSLGTLSALGRSDAPP